MADDDFFDDLDKAEEQAKSRVSRGAGRAPAQSKPLETPKPEAPKPEAPKPEAPKPAAPRPEAPKPEAPKPEAAQPRASQEQPAARPAKGATAESSKQAAISRAKKLAAINRAKKAAGGNSQKSDAVNGNASGSNSPAKSGEVAEPSAGIAPGVVVSPDGYAEIMPAEGESLGRSRGGRFVRTGCGPQTALAKVEESEIPNLDDILDELLLPVEGGVSNAAAIAVPESMGAVDAIVLYQAPDWRDRTWSFTEKGLCIMDEDEALAVRERFPLEEDIETPELRSDDTPVVAQMAKVNHTMRQRLEDEVVDQVLRQGASARALATEDSHEPLPGARAFGARARRAQPEGGAAAASGEGPPTEASSSSAASRRGRAMLPGALAAGRTRGVDWSDAAPRKEPRAWHMRAPQTHAASKTFADSRRELGTRLRSTQKAFQSSARRPSARSKSASSRRRRHTGRTSSRGHLDAAEAATPEMPAYWPCPDCGAKNDVDSMACLGCGWSGPPVESFAPAVERWECPHCDELNKADRSCCNNCGRPRPSGPGRGQEDFAQEGGDTMVVSVTCLKASLKKLQGVPWALRVRLPLCADVATLREVMWQDLPPDATVYAEVSKAEVKTGFEWLQEEMLPLTDDDAVPEQVVISEFKGRRTFVALFSDSECRLAMRLLKEHFLRPESQQQLDELEQRAGGDERIYQAELAELLVGEVYPGMVPHFDLPRDDPGGAPTTIMMGMAMNERRFLLPLDGGDVKGRLRLLALWHQTEVLMRHQEGVRRTLGWAGHLQQQGAPPLEELLAEAERAEGGV